MKKIAVTGGKGGTGKSTIATALAHSLSKKHRVLLVDADVDCPNDHLLLGIKREKISTVKQRIPLWDYNKCVGCGKCVQACKTNAVFMARGKPSFLEQQCNGCGACKLVCPVNAISWGEKEIGYLYKGKAGRIDFLSGELKVNEPVSEFVVDALKEEAEKKASEYDYILYDTAAGTHCDVIEALKGTGLALAVTEPTPLGEHDLELIIGLAERLGIGYEIILNRFQEGKEALIEEAASRHGKTIAARIPYSKKIIELYSKGKPVEHDSIEKIRRLIE